MPGHVILLGDSVFDNAAYTAGEPQVVEHLRGLLPTGWGASLRAVDGATTSDLAVQLPGVPAEATHLVVSIGGNDALLNSDVLGLPASSTSDALKLLGQRVARFEADYRAAVGKVLALSRETGLCTIYNGNLEPDVAPIARIALMTFNDVILRVAFEQGVGVIDLRLVCDDPEDYANPIEPSGTGGRKIAQAIVTILGAGDGTKRHTVVVG